MSFCSGVAAMLLGRRAQEMLGEEVFQQPDLHGDAEAESDAAVDGGAEEGEAVDGARVNPSSTDLGKRVLFVSQDKREKCGVLRFFGVPEFAEGTWCGIELDEALGRNNGSIHGIRYFSCEASHGVFVPVGKVELESAQRVRTRPVKKASSGLEREMAHRLNQPPVLGSARKHATVTNWRQPMKAFAPRGVSQESPPSRQQRRGGAGLRPFRAGGMYKAQSTENLRQVKEREGPLAEHTPMKKSSSERDLRSGKLAHGPQKPKPPVRTASTSDIVAAQTSKQVPRRRSLQPPAQPSNPPPSATPPSLPPPTTPLQRWPKQSTPYSSRSDSGPDGCSSPDSSETCSSCSSHEDDSLLSSSTVNGLGTSLAGSSQTGTSLADSSPAIPDCAFITTPDPIKPDSQPVSETPPTGPAPHRPASVPLGLTTHVTQLVESQSGSVGDCRVRSPEHSGRQTHFFNQQQLGSSTLPHPLARASAPSEAEEALHSNGHSGLADQAPLDTLKAKNLSAEELLQMFQLHKRHWLAAQAHCEARVSALESERDNVLLEIKKVEATWQNKLHEAESRHRSELRQLSLRHQQELIALQKSHQRVLDENLGHQHTVV